MEYNFGAGPAMCAPEVLHALERAERGFKGTGIPLSSINHRHSKFEEMVDTARGLVKKLLGVPDGYSVLFVPGGATNQFTSWALNIVDPRLFKPSVGYVDSGHWGHEAYTLADRLYQGSFCRPRKVVSAGPEYRVYPKLDYDAWRKPLDYLHIVTNETVNGTRLQNLLDVPECDKLVVVADMTSEIFSRPIPWDRFGVVYAGTQKQLGEPGALVLVIVKDRLLQAGHWSLTEPQSYVQQLRHHGGLRNTVPTRPFYSVYLTLQWIEEHGGASAMEDLSIRRAAILYKAIDESGGFYHGVADPASRSRMNVTFTLHNPGLQPHFLAYCEQAGLVGLRGHVGAEPYLGPHLRASLYNVMPLRGVDRLCEVMRNFQKLRT